MRDEVGGPGVDALEHQLTERVKELTLLHSVTRLLQSSGAIDEPLLQRLVFMMVAAWQYPEVCEARIAFNGFDVSTPGWKKYDWVQSVQITGTEGHAGIIEVAYREERPFAGEGPFLLEERALIGSVARILQGHGERFRMQAAIAKSEEEFRSVVDNAAIGIAMLDLEGRVVHGNPALARVVGCPIEDFSGKEFFGFSHVEDAQEVQTLFNDLIEGRRKSFLVDSRMHSRDRGVVRGRLNVIITHGSDGHPRFAVAMFEDMTEFLRVEQETTQLQAQLRQAQKLEAVGSLASGLAHDFNNIMTVILSNCEFLMLGSEPDVAVELLSEIRQAAQRAAGLTRQLLMFCRKSVVDPAVLDPGHLILDLERFLQRLIGGGIELTSVIIRPTWNVFMDPGQLEQVVMNLVVNARDAMPRGGRLIIGVNNVTLDHAVARTRGLSPGDYVEITVTDNGHGIEPSVLERIFDPFFTTKDPSKGTGIGLSVVLGIVKQNSGHIQVESVPGQRTTFHVYLPRTPESPSYMPIFNARALLPGGDETILVVENEAMLRKVYRNALQSQGYQVLEAEDDRAAFELATNHPAPIHLVLCDVVMSSMTGWDLMIKIHENHPGARVLLVSGASDDALVRGNIDRSADRFLQKPFPSATLVRKVREVLDEPPKATGVYP